MTQRALAFPPYIPKFFALFALCGTKDFHMYASDVAAREASDFVDLINARRSRGLWFTGSRFKACA